jgi:hypothetical protein
MQASEVSRPNWSHSDIFGTFDQDRIGRTHLNALDASGSRRATTPSHLGASIRRRIPRAMQGQHSNLRQPTTPIGSGDSPVYCIEVCQFKTLATCRFDREDVWTALADWLLIEYT